MYTWHLLRVLGWVVCRFCNDSCTQVWFCLSMCWLSLLICSFVLWKGLPLVPQTPRIAASITSRTATVILPDMSSIASLHPVTHYNITYSLLGDSLSYVSAPVDMKLVTLTLMPNSNYTVQLQAIGPQGESPLSSTASFTTLDIGIVYCVCMCMCMCACVYVCVCVRAWCFLFLIN